MIRNILLLNIFVLINGCTEKQILPTITFIKLGPAEISSKSDSLIPGSAFYIQTNFQEDSIYIKINVHPDEIDSIDIRKPPITMKARIMDTLKNACINFIMYSKKLPNGNLPNAYFEEPAIYNGGAFLIYYIDNFGVEHCFCYVLKDLSSETQKLHNLFMDYYYQNGISVSYNRNFIINSDSIARTLSLKKNMKCIRPLVQRVDQPTIKFIPKGN
jgi:hypothetical protein